MRYAMNAEPKDFQAYLDDHSGEDKKDKESREISKGINALARAFGGGR